MREREGKEEEWRREEKKENGRNREKGGQKMER